MEEFRIDPKDFEVAAMSAIATAERLYEPLHTAREAFMAAAAKAFDEAAAETETASA